MIYLTPGFRKKLAADDRDYLAYADITLASGQVLNLTNTEIWQDGFQVEEAVSDDNTFGALGAAIIGAGTLIIDNTRGQYTQYDFLNADVVLSIALMIDDTTPARKETVKMGTFRVDDAQYNEATITLSLLDLMEQFDRPYTLTGIVYPATLIEIIRNACTQCSVTLATLTFPRDTYEIADPPADECTFREVISWAATLAGCFARCNKDGELEIKWFDTDALEDDTGTDGGVFDSGTPYYSTGDTVEGGSFNPWNTGDAVDGGQVTDPIPVHYIGGLYQQDICVDETVITGVRISVDNPDSSADEPTLIYTAGTSGYEVQIESNPFITPETAQTHANWLGARLIGLHFRKCNIQHVDDPAVEAGDVGLLFDSKGNAHPILITRMSFEIGGPQTIVCASDTPAHNSATRYAAVTKSYAEMRKRLKDQIDSFDVAMNNLRNDIANAKGLYADEIEDPDNPGATIYVLHDKPVLAQSPVRIMISSVGVTVTANGTDPQPDWYGLRVNGDMIARIMNTIGLNFDWGTGGTLTLGGQNNINGKITMLDASGNVIGSWDNEELEAIGNLRMRYQKESSGPSVYNTEVVGAKEVTINDSAGVIKANTIPLTSYALYVEEYKNESPTSIPLDTAIYLFTGYGKVGGGKINGLVSLHDFIIKSNGNAYLQLDTEARIGRATTTDIAYLSVAANGVWTFAHGTRTKNGNTYTNNTGAFMVVNLPQQRVSLNGTYYQNGQPVQSASSSSKRYKHDIKPLESEEMDPRRLLDLPAKQFVFNDDYPLQYADMAGKALPGFIAEEVAEIYPAAAIYKDGKVESWDERRIIPGMLALIQEQEKRITKQEQEIEELKAQVKALAQAIGR